MKGWLSETWEANWRPFQYFNFYRLIAGVLFIFVASFSEEWLKPAVGRAPGYFPILGLIYILAVAAGIVASVRWQRRFNLQLTLQVLADVGATAGVMLASGGVSSGVGLLLLISLAAASLVGMGRLVLFYAALATLGVLLMEVYGILTGRLDLASIPQAGMLSAGFFATAVLARLLGQRAMVNEELARRRGEALENQIVINQRVIERMQDGMLVVTPDGRVQRHNPMAEIFLGVRANDGSRLSDYDLALGRAYAQWRDGAGDDGLALAGAEGRELWARFERTSSGDGEALVFLEDVGRIRERAQQLKLASLGRLTANIAHEIRNPLASISHAGDLLAEERREDVRGRLLRILRDNVGRLDRIIRDVLELGRRDRVVQEPIRLAEYVAGFVEEFAPVAGVTPGVIVVDVAPEAVLCFDRSQLQQIMSNLLGNACRHSRCQVGSVRVFTARGAEGRVELHVEDDGEGIPEGIAAQVFEPFFTTHHQGTGLGLFIARELCEANHATLVLVPSVRGAHFVLQGRSDPCRQVGQNVVLAAS